MHNCTTVIITHEWKWNAIRHGNALSISIVCLLQITTQYHQVIHKSRAPLHGDAISRVLPLEKPVLNIVGIKLVVVEKD